ncbi:hypothetical protein L6164_037258 [Bauhinia variegata]|uniref:Uncharacterized protein n=1 Tax=Bauhinia variegata TaxID=167791 RepID=A0ACB9KJG4_BAUVA|nr:hypothetical protein L6164_037258 [Bauhinia variegata]
MECVQSVSMKVLWNGAKIEEFKPGRGVRQGDPISPYIFVTCMDKLSRLIAECVEDGSWKPMRTGRNDPLISHLMFADDLLLLAEASEQHIEQIWGKLTGNQGWTLGNGKQSRFWADASLGEGRTIIDSVDFRIPDYLMEDRVAEYTNVDGGWDWDRLRMMLPAIVIDKIGPIVPPDEGDGDDKIHYATVVWQLIYGGA